MKLVNRAKVYTTTTGTGPISLGSAFPGFQTFADAGVVATAVEGSLLDENDGQKILEAIVNAIGNTNVDEISLVAAIRADIERAGGRLDVVPTTAEITTALQAVADDFKADVSALAKTSELSVVNEGVKKASLLVPHSQDI